MNIKRFRIVTYRNIIDSGWVDIENDVVCFVGQNQSGKTNILKCLHGFNPFSEEDQYSHRVHWPKNLPFLCKNKQFLACAIESTLRYRVSSPKSKSHSENENGGLHNEEDKSSVDGEVREQNDAEEIKLIDSYVLKNYNNEYFAIPLSGLFFEPESFDSLRDLHDDAFEKWPDELKSSVNDLSTRFFENMESANVIDAYLNFIDIKIIVEQYYAENARSADSTLEGEFCDKLWGYYYKTLEPMMIDINVVKSHVPSFIYMDQYREFSGVVRYKVMDADAESEQSKTNAMMLNLGDIDLDYYINIGKEYFNADESEEDDVVREINDVLKMAGEKISTKFVSKWTNKDISIQLIINNMNITFISLITT